MWSGMDIISDYSKDVGRELDAKISLIIGRTDNGDITAISME